MVNFDIFNISAGSHVIYRRLFLDLRFNLICICSRRPTQAFLPFKVILTSFKASKRLPHISFSYSRNIFIIVFDNKTRKFI